MRVQFRYNDGYMKICNVKEAEILRKMRRGVIVPDTKPAVQDTKPTKRKTPKASHFDGAV